MVAGQRLFGPRAATAAAFLVAIYPMAFQFEELLYSEAIATPLLLAVLVLAWTKQPTARRAALTGAVLGVAMLTRPSLGMLAAAIVVAWVALAGWRRGIGLSVVTGVVAALVIAPWTIRNHHVDGGFVPISIQDAAFYGTFNDEAAHDQHHPWAWRPVPHGYLKVLDRPTSDHEFASRLRKLGTDYVRAHPTSVLKAFYWNGINRTFDVRSPTAGQYEAPFEGPRGLVLEARRLVLPVRRAGRARGALAPPPAARPRARRARSLPRDRGRLHRRRWHPLPRAAGAADRDPRRGGVRQAGRRARITCW